VAIGGELKRASVGCCLTEVETGKKRGTTMRNLAASVKRFLVSEAGPTAVEYAVMLALIVVVCLAAITAIGQNANTQFETVRDALQ
jgi:pilus assembly protein Flp/PilA